MVLLWLHLGRVALILLTLAHGLAIGSPAGGLDEIQRLAGCFEVSYRFAEDGTRDMFSEGYRLTNPTTQWLSFQKTGDAYLLQHVLLMGSRPMPHWHEVWVWQPDKQAWTQEVRGGAPEPDSELRYSCTAPWIANRWECHAGKAQKPLRDAGEPFGRERSEYDWLDRKNVILVTPNGWVQNEHNRKMKSSGEVVSYELGWITYTRIEEERCEPAPEQFPKESARDQ